ncbi:hypothetical protein BC826DRAFT_133965 [Russula brevipes]|nr:hypothetical protein BC826DRAFT_133965 [Russula brevipes]
MTTPPVARRKCNPETRSSLRFASFRTFKRVRRHIVAERVVWTLREVFRRLVSYKNMFPGPSWGTIVVMAVVRSKVSSRSSLPRLTTSGCEACCAFRVMFPGPSWGTIIAMAVVRSKVPSRSPAFIASPYDLCCVAWAFRVHECSLALIIGISTNHSREGDCKGAQK